MEQLQKKYGLATAVAMVVGVVIGSGVFFKADDILKLTNGNLIYALIAWGIGAFSMIFGALVFAEYAQRIEKSNGLVDYSEAAYGPRFGYLVGWFKGIIYFSPLSAILAWVASLYTMILFKSSNPVNSKETWILAFIYLSIISIINWTAPILAGKLQVTTTIIKLIPLFAVAIIGTISGIINGVTVSNFIEAANQVGSSRGTLASAVVATAFAYEGWIIAITINNEIKDSKINLPKALVIGTFIVFVVYISYFLGIAGVLKTGTIVNEGDNAIRLATTQLFGNIGSVVLTAFVVISCLGTLNGLVLSNMRIPYSLAIRNQGPIPNILSKINPKTNTPINSGIFSNILTLIYLGLWYASLNNLFGRYIGLDEIPIVMVYGIYLSLYIWYIKEFKELNFFKRFVIPICAIIGALIILYGGITNPAIGIYLVISLLVFASGLLFYRKA
ncbi:amino acid/polyamine/organocation transporter (APC superfamily) [Hypnocyclicus thermotrophus]|uniref:Amino acid/polyamine/organocation transporter (APC superfamily) n=1 Tax=Hypnocyclicus thermotrophus TaxID=1627895 RepID=A0AA46E1P5_9FUSO|nr:amino acid permease [Hypnocyclicus thermotrophus]TDT72558.1 amino acid/polyamine/organocation transporter (APC superfamily) [Hypnocyclicus thermotrophus]